MSAGARRDRQGRPQHLVLRAVLVVLLAALLAASPPHRASEAAPAPINGSGSSYVALAMQQWVADAQTRGLRVNYLPTGSPQGLTSFAQNLVDFAATEAEFSALQSGADPARGYQYIPSTAGAVAIMYNVLDKAGRKVDYLQLSKRTVARIFTGDISRWNDPAITADNKGVELPDQPITVVYRGGQSGTTALFYDFVANVAPDVFGPWAARNQFPTDVRIIQLDSSPNFAPKTQAFGGSDQIAQFIASPGGLWSIGYDEFGYSKVYNAPSAYIENGAGKWVLPFARNISAALESATLRPDLSQELSGVYNSANPEAYPISAYSYIVTQCAPAGDRPTCKTPYINSGVTETLTEWLRYIACEGQIPMADIGYSPLPPNLSQEVANSIARMNGTPPEMLTADNCPNPRFRGDTGPASPPPPLDSVDPAGLGLGGGGSSAAAASGSLGAVGAGSGASAGDGAEAALGAAGRTGSVLSAGGGSRDWRAVAPVLYERTAPALSVALPLLALAALLVLPPAVMGHRRRGAPRP